MEYREFCNYVKDNILGYMPQEYENAEVFLSTTLKNNSVVLQGLAIRTDEVGITPKVYLESFYRHYEDGETIDSVCKDLAEEYQRYSVKGRQFDAGMVRNFDIAKEHLMTKVLSAKHNKMLLRERPSTKLDDLAVFYQINVGRYEDGEASIPVTNAIMHEWGVTVPELHKIAVENTERTNPATLSSITSMIYGQEENFFAGDEYEPDGPLLVLTNTDRIGGAATIANPEILERVSDVIGDDYYMPPMTCSIRELFTP